MFDFIAQELHEDYVLLRPQRVVQDAQNHKVHFFDRVARENRVDLALHAWLHLAQGKVAGASSAFIARGRIRIRAARNSGSNLRRATGIRDYHDTCRISGEANRAVLESRGEKKDDFARRTVTGVVELPGDKSISHRYAILASLAEGTSEIRNYSPAADCASTLECFRRLGIEIDANGERVRIAGKGLDGLKAPKRDD